MRNIEVERSGVARAVRVRLLPFALIFLVASVGIIVVAQSALIATPRTD